MPKTKAITIQERFRKQVTDRWAANRLNIAVSVIAEEYGELKELLDTVIHEID